MPVQVSSSVKEANSVGVNTSTLYHSAQKPCSEASYKLEDFEKTQLEEVLDMCADYERQIEAEQKEALRLRQSSEASNGNPEWNNNLNTKSGGHFGNTGVLLEPFSSLSKPTISKITTIFEDESCYQPTSLHPVTPTSPTGNQWSPGGTMITPNR